MQSTCDAQICQKHSDYQVTFVRKPMQKNMFYVAAAATVRSDQQKYSVQLVPVIDFFEISTVIWCFKFAQTKQQNSGSEIFSPKSLSRNIDTKTKSYYLLKGRL